MKTLQNHTIIYDEQCPLCNAYTGHFIRSGMLDQNGRTPFNEQSTAQFPTVNWERAKTEIALVDRVHERVYYGVDSLVKIIGNRFPALLWFMKHAVIRWIIQKIYFFVSYNRKVIAPGKVFEEEHLCAPPMNYTYRWLYIAFAWLITSVVLTSYSALLHPIVPTTAFGREFLICGGQILFQGLIVFSIRPQRLIHYLGNMMTVSLIGALLLLPALLMGLFYQSVIFFLVYFFSVVAWMFYEHGKRVKTLGIASLVSFTWMLYRLLIVGWIFLTSK
jgi:predicted DCC family thiol-disulfide oxidoreductase YuxK